MKLKAVSPGLSPILGRFTNFALALSDDLNISAALAVIFDLVREINALSDQGAISVAEAKEVLNTMKKFDSVLGVLTFEKQEEEIPQELQEAFEKRLQARKDKNWKLADELRDYITKSGYLIEDTPSGARLKKG